MTAAINPRNFANRTWAERGAGPVQSRREREARVSASAVLNRMTIIPIPDTAT